MTTERDRSPQPSIESSADYAALLAQAAGAARQYLASLDDRPVAADSDVAALRTSLVSSLSEHGEAATDVLADLAEAGEQGTVATAGPRYFGFVTGGNLPVAAATETLLAAWDQNAAMAVMSPLASVVEEIAAQWLIDLLDLPDHTSCGLVTGGQSANTTALAVARHHVLAHAGWDVATRGLNGAPPITVVVGAERHATIDAALAVLGLGAPGVIIDADDQGRMDPGALARALVDTNGPAIVCLQAGNVVSGAFDPFVPLTERANEVGAWVHVDGAFGAWAAASPTTAGLCAGMAGADSWAVDGHKLLNVGYDSGFVFTAHPDSHLATCTSSASYYVQGGDEAPRHGMEWVLDASRRARGVTVYAALRTLGRRGVADLVDRLCRRTRLMAELMDEVDGIAVCNDVVFNQLALRFGDDDDHTRAVVEAVQADGTCWAGGATWRGDAVMRWSVANWSTTDDDIRRSADAVATIHRNLVGR